MSDEHQSESDDLLPTEDGVGGTRKADALDATQHGADSVPLTRAAEQLEFSSVEDSFDAALLSAAGNSSSLGRLGKYDILEVVGKGGMGVVLRGFDESLHRPVAIKMLSRQLATSPTARRRFIREARAAAAVNHPNVVTIHAVEEQEGVPYLVMEFVSGESLHDWIRQHAPLPLADVLRFGSQIAAGLAAAHAQGVIHRDIKPANIMLEDNIQRVKITDFGLARVAMDNSDLTSQGHRLGTPAYMSPEQVIGAQVDERTDLFSFGCVMYAMITGHSPFRGTHSFDTARKILEEKPESLDQIDADIPPFLAEIVDQLLAKKPSSRFDSASEVAELLNHYTARLNQTRTDELGSVLRGETLRRLKNRRLRHVAAAISIAIVGLMILVAWKPWVTRGSPAKSASEVAGPVVIASEPSPLTGTLRVGQSGESQFNSIAEALSRAAPGATIEVTDESTYNAQLLIDDADRWRNITIVTRHNATLTAPFPKTIIRIEATPGVTIRGFRVEACCGQHGFEVTGPCAGLLVEEITAQRIPNPDSPTVNNFVYLHAGAAGTETSPIVFRNLTLSGEGHGIALGEQFPTRSDIEYPVRWVRIEECSLFNPYARSNYRLFLLNHLADICVTRNTFADALLGISVMTKDANQMQRIRIHQNTFHNLGSLMTPVIHVAQDDITIASNLIARTDRLTPGQGSRSAIPENWFSQNAWIDGVSTTDASVSAIATVVTGVTFESEDPFATGYLRPTLDSSEILRGVADPPPGRYGSTR